MTGLCLNQLPRKYKKYLYFWTEGDIKIVSSNKESVTITNKEQYGKGRLYASITYSLDSIIDSSFLLSPCVKNGCWGVGDESTVLQKYVDVYQKFTLEELAPNDKIYGNDYINVGEEYSYSIKPILTRNLTSMIGVDVYTWEIPPYMEDVFAFEYGDASSRVLNVDANAVINFDTIKVILGRCNADNPLIKVLSKGTEEPTVTHDNLVCTEFDTVYFRIDSVKTNYKYWWRSSNSFLNIVPVQLDNSHVMVISDGYGGAITLFTSNGRDTVSQAFEITKKVTKPIKIVGDTNCVKAGDILSYNLYPSPNVDVVWALPEGWFRDNNNPYSSSVYLSLSGSSVAGYIKTSSRFCGEIFDSIFVTVVADYIEEGIMSDSGTCFKKGEIAKFHFKKDPNAKSYQWTFPNGWIPQTYSTEDINDTVIEVEVGETGSIELTATTLCGEGWTMTFDDVNLYPFIESIEMEDKPCVNDGVVDNITLSAKGADAVTYYKWIYPNTWNETNSNNNTITLETDNKNGNREVFVVGINDQCGYSDTIKTTIIQDGAGVDVNLVYQEIVYPFPLDFLPPNRTITAIVSPGATTDYNYEWYENEAFVHSGNNEYSVFDIDTANNNYCVIVSSKLSSSSCVTRKWLKSSGTNEDTEYTSTVVEAIPPAAAPTILTPEPPDNSEEEVIEESQEQESEQTTAPNKIESKKPSFSFYPNPSKGNIHVQFDGNADYIEIFNMNGMSVLRKRCTSDKKQLNVGNLKAGLYIMKVTFGNNIVAKKLQIIK